ncbi:MAG: DUF1292 domain-containing protein [Erysipelotrichaceae bacterium]|nr:DUF1292 domain-containing protein [Erysipelotrichaceae bacterium]
MSENKIYITNDEGREMEMNVLFTFDMNDKNYAVLFETGNEDELYAVTYDEEGNMFVVEDDEERAMVEEVVAAFDGVFDEEAA